MRHLYLIVAWALLEGATAFAQAPNSAPREVRFAAHQPAVPSVPPAEPLALPPVEPLLTLAELEQLALAHNPAITRAAAEIRAAQGTRWQAGLPPNPEISYQGNEINNEGRAGQQGAALSQTFITGGKLGLARAAARSGVAAREQQFAAAQMRVASDVRIAFYQALAAQRRVALAAQLVRLGQDYVTTAEALLRAQETSRADLLQAQVEAHSARLQQQVAENELAAAWRQLAAVVGAPGLKHQPLADTLDQSPQRLEWESTRARLLAASPELSAAQARIEQARWQLAREQAEPVPDISVQAGAAYDHASQDPITNVQVQIPVPLLNRNQGGIRRAGAELTSARANLQRIELNLEQRLAEVFQRYADARARVETYSTQILPDSAAALELVAQGYRQGEIAYLTLLTVQRTYYQTHLAYVESLGQLHQALAEIDNFLLRDSLGP